MCYQDIRKENEVSPRQGSTWGKNLPEEAVLLTDGVCCSRSVWLILSVPFSSSTKQACEVEVDQGFPQKTNALERQVRRRADCMSLGSRADGLMLSGDLAECTS